MPGGFIKGRSPCHQRHRGWSPPESTAAPIASGYFFLDFRFAHRRFCAAAIFARVAAENRRRFRGFRSIVAAGSADTSTG